MESVIERIEKGHFWKFHGGIHPPENKFLTNDKPIRHLPLPKQLVIPVRQHIGKAGQLLVAPGDKVLKGQALTKRSGPMSVPVHAPTSGTITGIEKAVIAHPSGMSEDCIHLCPDGEEKWTQRQICEDYSLLSRETLIEKIANAGIAGMGGAGFPTHIKASSKPGINYLIINAAECEPYISADDLLIREHSTAIVDGIKILDSLLQPVFILIGIEDNKPAAIAALKQASKVLDKIKVCVLPTKYPTGGEKQLVKVLTGKEVPSGVLPSSLGIVMQNVATCFAISDAIINDKPLLQRVVTVSGQALSKPQNVWALLGTPVADLLAQCGYDDSQPQQHVIMGGPMMGFSLPSSQVPVVKTTNCVLAPSAKEIPDDNKEVECIRCGQCAEVCPSQLLPQELQWSAKAKDYAQLQKLNLFDCIDCGACAYVCPSQIPLVHYYRIAKAEIRHQQVLDLKAEKAKGRFEARKARLEKDKLARELKQQKASQARRAAMTQNTPDATNASSAVADALARVKARKAQADNTAPSAGPSADAGNDDKKSQVAAAIARRKAKKLAEAQAQNSESLETEPQLSPENKTDTSTAAEKTSQDQASESEVDQGDSEALAKKSRIAATVAKAKAKAAARQSEAQQPNQGDSEDQAKKARIVATLAKAKAKAAARNAEAQQPSQDDAIPSSGDDDQGDSKALAKKARIAATVAKAKAKALARKQQKSE